MLTEKEKKYFGYNWYCTGLSSMVLGSKFYFYAKITVSYVHFCSTVTNRNQDSTNKDVRPGDCLSPLCLLHLCSRLFYHGLAILSDSFTIRICAYILTLPIFCSYALAFSQKFVRAFSQSCQNLLIWPIFRHACSL